MFDLHSLLWVGIPVVIALGAGVLGFLIGEESERVFWVARAQALLDPEPEPEPLPAAVEFLEPRHALLRGVFGYEPEPDWVHPWSVVVDSRLTIWQRDQSSWVAMGNSVPGTPYRLSWTRLLDRGPLRRATADERRKWFL